MWTRRTALCDLGYWPRHLSRGKAHNGAGGRAFKRTSGGWQSVGGSQARELTRRRFEPRRRGKPVGRSRRSGAEHHRTSAK